LIVHGDFNLPDLPLLRYSLNIQFDLVFVLDPCEVTVCRIDALVVPEDRYHPTLEI